MLALIPLLPLAGFVVNALLGRRLPKSISGGIACAVMLASLGVNSPSKSKSPIAQYAGAPGE